MADLFDLDHARKVLAAFGRAFGKLPENPGETSKEQRLRIAGSNGEWVVWANLAALKEAWQKPLRW